MADDVNKSIPARSGWTGSWIAASVVLLLAVLVVELIVPIRRQSPVFDEGCHILAGYSYWTRADFGVNPEHPPLVKLLAAFPLLSLRPHYPKLPPGFFKVSEFLGGRFFLFSNNVDQVLTRSRLAVSLLTVLTALLVFAAAYEMFGKVVAILSLVLCVFEPNLVANGSLVTTDMAMALFLLATVYAFYRYVKKPTVARLLVTCLAAGLCLVAKHSGVLWVPVLVVLAAAEVAFLPCDSRLAQGGRRKYLLRLTASLAVVGLVSLAILWALYGFRYAARPGGQQLVPTLDQYVSQVQRPIAEKVVRFAARHHLLPEAYIYGWTDVVIAPRYVTPYLFGKVYPRGQWFYPLATFVIKSTLGFMLLLVLALIGLALYGTGQWREFLYLSVPAVIYAAAALASGFNHGNRYLVPMYPFLLIFAAWGGWRLARTHRSWLVAVGVLVVFHVISSLRAFPDYLPYSNELFGGPTNTYKALSDSNVDWGQQLKLAKKYLDERGIKECWFDDFSRSVSDPDYYGIPCKPLLYAIAFEPMPLIPAHIEGTILISDNELSGNIWGPEEINPYAQFNKIHPDALIAGGLFVFHGQFDVSLAAATVHANIAFQLIDSGKLNEALTEAQTAVQLAPGDVGSQFALGDALTKLNRKDEAKSAYTRGLTLAETVQPEFQSSWAEAIKRKLADLSRQK